jgi:PH domain
MLVGRPPFQGTSQYLTFEQIRKISFEFPENIDAEGLDLVRKLLVLEPSLRLGAGGPGSENGILALKNHAFVQDFNIANILSSVVPYSDWDLFLKPKALEDLDDDDEDFEVQLLNKTNEETKASSQPMILVSGIIKKKCGWFYKKRYLIISNEPRIYYSHTNNQKVTDIALSKELKAETKAGNDFVITNPQRSYYFREMISNPQRWVDAINKVIIDHYY